MQSKIKHKRPRERHCTPQQTQRQKFMKSLPIIACLTLMILGVFTLANWAFTLANYALTLFNQTSDLTGQPKTYTSVTFRCEDGMIDKCTAHMN